MSLSIGTSVEEVMMRVILTVKESDKMEDVATLFEAHNINAAPVVDEDDTCIGMITSHDLVEFESTRSEIQNELSHGKYFNMARYGEAPKSDWPIHFDEVGYNMSRSLVTAEHWHTLSRIASSMCEKHIHHVLIVDEQTKPVGIISSLDILSHLTGTPIKRGAPIRRKPGNESKKS